MRSLGHLAMPLAAVAFLAAGGCGGSDAGGDGDDDGDDDVAEPDADPGGAVAVLVPLGGGETSTLALFGLRATGELIDRLV